MDNEQLGIVVKNRSFVGDGDLVVSWKVVKHSSYYEPDKDNGEILVDLSMHIYDGSDELYLGAEAVEALITELSQALAAYTHINNNKEVIA